MSWRLINISAVLATVLVGVAVLLVKNEVHEEKAAITQLQREIRAHQSAIRVLNAEWALLASPDLLQQRSMRYLALMPLKPDQVVESAAAIPFRPEGEKAAQDRGVVFPAQYQSAHEQQKSLQSKEGS